MPYTLRAEYAGVFMHIGEAVDAAEAALMVRVAAGSMPISCLRLTDPNGDLLDLTDLLNANPPERA